MFYQPELDEIIGIGRDTKQVIERIVKFVKARTPLLFYGDPGTGKTSTAHAVARHLGLQVIELNASDERSREDLDKIRRLVRTKTLVPILILLDEADGLRNWNLLTEILDKPVHPVILTANRRDKIPNRILKLCEQIKFNHPKLQDVARLAAKLARKEGLRLKPGTVTGDVRASLNALLYGGEVCKEMSDFDLVAGLFTGKDVQPEQHHVIWVLDNASSFYVGRDLYRAVRLCTVADKTGRPDALRFLPRGSFGDVKYPHYYRRLRQNG